MRDLIEVIPEWSSGFLHFHQFQSEFGNKEFMIWATVSSRSCFCWLYRASPFGCKEYNQSDFGVDHLVMSMCRVFSFVVGRGCLLWPVHSLGKTLLAFALLHAVLQGKICLLLQVFLDFLLLHSSLFGIMDLQVLFGMMDLQKKTYFCMFILFNTITECSSCYPM